MHEMMSAAWIRRGLFYWAVHNTETTECGGTKGYVIVRQKGPVEFRLELTPGTYSTRDDECGVDQSGRFSLLGGA